MEPSDRKLGDGSEEDLRPPSKRFRWTTTDDEVEEFFAIIRRMREASRCLASRHTTAKIDRPTKWRPEFSPEDFAGSSAAIENGEMATTAKDGPPAAASVAPRFLDLNADPETETLSVVSPSRSDVTPHCARTRLVPSGVADCVYLGI